MMTEFGEKRAKGDDFIRPLSEAEAGYVAGLVDGEGNIRIGDHGKRTVSIRIANTDVTVMRWLNAIGGRVGVDYQTKGKWRTCYCWKIGSWESCYGLLTQIVPHMIIKRELAERALALISSWRVGPKRKPKTHCKHGHELTPGNVYMRARGSRICKACSKRSSDLTGAMRQRRHRRKLRARMAEGTPPIPFPPS